ncbi:hypothetical protein D3C86_2048170 [compost metagenome]
MKHRIRRYMMILYDSAKQINRFLVQTAIGVITRQIHIIVRITTHESLYLSLRLACNFMLA